MKDPLVGVVIRHVECRDIRDEEKLSYTEISWWGDTEPQNSMIPGIHGGIGDFVEVSVKEIDREGGQ